MDEPARSRLRPASSSGLTSPDPVTALLTATTAPGDPPASIPSKNPGQAADTVNGG